MTSTSGDQPAKTQTFWKKPRAYVSKHRGMAWTGLAVGTFFAVPFAIAAVLAATRGEDIVVKVWGLSAALMIITALSLFLWSARRD